MLLQNLFKTSKGISACVVVIVVVIAAYLIMFDRIAPTTNDSVLDAYVVKVKPEVKGTVRRVYIGDNQHVKKGDPLIMIDPSVYKFQYEKSKAQLFEVQDQIRSYEEAVLKAEALYEDTKKDYEDTLVRFNEDKDLYERKVIDLRSFLSSQDRLNDAEDEVQAAELSLLQARETLGPSVDGVNIHLLKAEATLKECAYYLHKTVIKAPSSGYVTNLRITEGSYADIGATQLAFVNDEQWWVLSNLKENNIGRIKPGQKADVSFSLYPGKVFEGYVDSVDWGVMNDELDESNYLAAVNKTNNWVRLAQRFPVRIKLKNPPKDFQLRVGASALVTVYTDDDDLFNVLPKIVHSIRSKLQYIY